MANARVLEREEYIEQAYFFRVFRERLAQNVPSQEILAQVRNEILSTTQLPYAIEFMAAELKHSGRLAPAMERLSHYFTPYQAFVVDMAEDERSRFSIDLALEVLEKEAEYKANEPTQPGLFVYQFETLCRNRLGYDAGIPRIAADPFYDENWRTWIGKLRYKIASVDFADLIYARSAFLHQELRRRNPNYQPRYPALFGEKEGKIAKANRGKDPLYLFAALQRQLGYPKVPRPRRDEGKENLLKQLHQKVYQLEQRVKILEAEVKGELDITQFYVQKEQSQREGSKPPDSQSVL